MSATNVAPQSVYHHSRLTTMTAVDRRLVNDLTKWSNCCLVMCNGNVKKMAVNMGRLSNMLFETVSGKQLINLTVCGSSATSKWTLTSPSNSRH